jgi:predicted acyl esterase
LNIRRFGKAAIEDTSRSLLKAIEAAAAVLLALGFVSAVPQGPPAESRDSQRQQAVAELPEADVRIEKAWIPMKDGAHLAVNLFMAASLKPDEKFPAILEYLPYRKDDWAAQRDYDLHCYFATRGYVSARVDIRGTGSSEGLPPDREYSEQEQQDGMEVIAWLARQPWSNGSVGMMGISWGGFNSIQMAMRHPPALRAIIAVDATEELYHDDIHYIDGMMHADEFELGMDQQIAESPAPEFSLDEKILAPRFDLAPWFLLYLHQQRDGPFWRRASLAPHYEAMRVPAFLIGGFYDGYRDNIPRMMERVKAPVKGLVGPWNHTYPHNAVPGPAIEWRAEAVRWWDYWLKGKANGILDEPRLEVYMRHWYPADPNLAEIPGEWRSEETWPPRELQSKILYLDSDHRLVPAAPAAGVHLLKYVPSAGADAGFWWGDLTTDQRPTDAFSLVYDSEPLAKDTAILGRPRALLQASATAPLADWFARLSDVAPDGTVTLVTGAGLNGTQRESASEPRGLEPGKTYSLEIEMHFTSWVFPHGHRIRVAISNALWPMIWPTPYPMTTSLELGGHGPSRLVLPVVPLEANSAPHFPAAGPALHLPGVRSTGETWPGKWSAERDEFHQSAKLEWMGDDGTEFPWGRMHEHEQLTYEAQDAHPEVSSVHGEADTTVELPDRKLVWRSLLEVRSDRTHFFYHYTRQLLENGRVVREKEWDDTIRRDYQ